MLGHTYKCWTFLSIFNINTQINGIDRNKYTQTPQYHWYVQGVGYIYMYVYIGYEGKKVF